MGVLIVCILSGLLITYTAENKTKSYGMMAYMIDRFSRIFISYIVGLMIVGVIDFVAIYIYPEYPYLLNTTVNFVGNLLMLENHPLFLSIFERYWSILKIIPFGSGSPLWSVTIDWRICICVSVIYYKSLNFKNAILWKIALNLPVYSIISQVGVYC